VSVIGRSKPEKRFTHSLNHPLPQARGEPQEAAREVRALLDLLRDNEAPAYLVAELQDDLRDANSHLKILDPEHGDEELVKSFEVARAKLLRYGQNQPTTAGALA